MKLILIGIQGSGKSTQGNLLSEKLGLSYLSSGYIFREMAREESKWGKYVGKTLSTGQLVADSKTIPIIEEYLKKPQYQKGYILDGFPRTLIQAQAFKELIDKVFYIKVSDKEVLKRLRLRVDKEKREDDSQQAIKRRIALFHKFTEPVLGYYKKRGLMIEVNGEQTIEQIHNDIMIHVKSKI